MRVTWTGLAVNLVLFVVKLAGGLLGGSQAVVADAIHTLSDMSTDVAILVGVRYWNRPPDEEHPYGHSRLETLVTLGIGLLLALVASGVLYNALATFHHPPKVPPGAVAFWAALLSIIAKEALYHYTQNAGLKIKSDALTANAWHHRSDALSSIPAALAVAGTAISPDWWFLDQIGAVLVAVLLYQAAYKIARPASDKLIDAGASREALDEIKRLAAEVNGVVSVHKIRSRYINSSSLTLDLHITVDAYITVHDGHEIARDVRRTLIQQGPSIADALVHVEPDED